MLFAYFFLIFLLLFLSRNFSHSTISDRERAIFARRAKLFDSLLIPYFLLILATLTKSGFLLSFFFGFLWSRLEFSQFAGVRIFVFKSGIFKRLRMIRVELSLLDNGVN